MKTFDPNEPRTWPALLTAAQVAAIWQVSPGHLLKLVADGSFVPMPVDQAGPRRWRRVDVLRVVEPGPMRRSA